MKRFNLYLTSKDLQSLEVLRKRTKSKSQAETIRRAIKVALALELASGQSDLYLIDRQTKEKSKVVFI